MAKKGKPISREIAQEMLYDADFMNKGRITIDEFVAYLQLVETEYELKSRHERPTRPSN
jgi:hypothetical protein